ncbi:extracellular solute-binding protein [Nocardioides sp. Kera G14]|uniref:extracellular solute-binding protein n=1 Tax=Nocardioides sp. Kera G14 TaxID=2884264 RepID=UPI001D11B23F|nr:extracellular solute-binding protein [Nocardioides sp. Kera G14]UDY23061.1 extracellular solute-binding protein [Nocardioides sp. Kera G14]
MLKQVAAACAAVLLLAACGSSDDTTPAHTPSPTLTPVNDPAKLTLGVWGNSTMVGAWNQAVQNYNATTDLADVTVKSWADDASMVASFADPSTPVPDVFLISRGDLEQLEADKRVNPVDNDLDARNVDIGDQYSRYALEAFSSDHRLQCMPYAASPQVVYYNTDLVDFPRMQAQGIDVPSITSSKSWTWDQFQLAAQEASKVAATKTGAHAFAVTPSLSGLAPFLLSAGGQLAQPDSTALSLSDDQTLDALGKVLPVLANPTLTTTAPAAKQLKWFRQGKLGMMVGDRSLVPELRSSPNLRWDVLPIPTVDTAATTGDYTALCISSKSERSEDAADLLVALTSEAGMKPITNTGYIVPVNQQVALSDEFLQTESSPLHASVFVNSVRNMQILPLTHQWSALETAVTAQVARLFVPGQLPVAIDQIAQQIDEASKTILGAATP